MRWLRFLHRYLGVAALAFLLILALTGGALVFKQDIWRLQYPALRAAAQNPDPAQLAKAFATIPQAVPGRVLLIRTPETGQPAFHVYYEGGEALFEQDTLALIDSWAWQETLSGILTQIHYRLAAGDAGKQFVGALGLVAGFMACTGIFLWWPTRRQFKWRSLAPRDLRRGSLLKMHRDLGVISALLIVLFALTGAGVVWGEPTRWLLNALLGGSPASAPRPVLATDAPAQAPGRAAIERAQSIFPGARLASWSPPAAGSRVHYFRFRQDGEAHPNGRSTVYMDAADRSVLSSSDALGAPRGEKVANWMYPLHAARVGGAGYRAAAVVAAIALSLMCLSGAVSFARQYARKRQPPGRPRSDKSDHLITPQ
jgi:uncharacterized iron-regulated membrane protein